MSTLRRCGFSLLELVVGLLVVALVLVLSVRLLRHSQSVFIDSQRMAPHPVARVGESLIRADVQSAGRIEADPSCSVELETWTFCGLSLVYLDGRGVRYDEILGRLERSSYDAEGRLIGTRPVLNGVSRFGWRLLAGGVVEIELAHGLHRNPGTRHPRSRRGMREQFRRSETMRVRYAMRNRQGRSSW